jgi:2-oxoglutarate ferredoxin oxidoreductase subunit delta
MKYWRTPLDAEKVKTPKGEITVIPERCKGCGICIEYCPKKILDYSKDINKKGYHYPEVKKDARCVNCHFCEILCPDFAIFSQEGSDAESEVKKK